MALLETATAYILGIITENEEVKKFPKDFITESMKWIRSWFLKDDPVVSSVVENPTLSDEVKKPVIEAKLKSLEENEAFMAALKTQLEAYAQQQARQKNILDTTKIEVKGDVVIGDKTAPNDTYDQKNVVKNSEIKSTEGGFRLGDG